MNSRRLGIAFLITLAATSFGLSHIGTLLVDQCPLGADVVRPDRSVCELAFGGLWVSMAIGVASGALAIALGLSVAALARGLGGRAEAWILRLADASFSLPDVLVLMVFQFALQTVGELKPALALRPMTGMIGSLALVGWAGPARMIRNRIWSLEEQEFVLASRALGGTPWHVLKTHLWPSLRPYVLTLFLARVPAAILAESTVSFLGIARMEPMSLGRYLGTSYSALVYEGGARVVLPAWLLLMLVVLAANLAAGSPKTKKPVGTR